MAPPRRFCRRGGNGAKDEAVEAYQVSDSYAPRLMIDLAEPLRWWLTCGDALTEMRLLPLAMALARIAAALLARQAQREPAA